MLYVYLNKLKEEKNGGGSRLRAQINSTAETENFLSRAYQNLLLRQHLEIIKSVPALMHDTQLSEASSYYYPFNQLTPLNSSTDFVPSQAETHFSSWFGGDLHNGDGTLESVVNTRKPSSSKSASKGSSLHYGSAMPSQQAPMPGTSSLSEFPHHPSNQPARLNSSTDFVPFQAETEMHSWDWPCGDLYNDSSDRSVRRPSPPNIMGLARHMKSSTRLVDGKCVVSRAKFSSSAGGNDHAH
uniref:Uncharacterized protein n=1 Tax=Globodera rostochiensis TaxID=31243 RepID=A0A914I4S1_GLORO